MAGETGRRRGKRPALRPPSRREVVNRYAPVAALNEDQIETIHLAALRILEELGMEVLSNAALDRYAAAGAEVDRESRRVRLDRGLVMEAIAKAPAAFTLRARNPARDVTFGGGRIVFTPVSSAPNVADLDRGRRPGSYADFCDLLRLAHGLDILHFIGGYPVEPVDLPVPTRHLDCHYGFITLTDRAWRTYALGRERSLDGIAMIALVLGCDREALAARPALMTMINTNSPLRLDGPMAEGLIAMAEAGQAVAITPFTLAGAMSPVTLAGALAQQNAEALATLALVEIVRPGAPVVYGGFTSNVDMKSGAPAFGTPESTVATLAGGQLARRYRLPYRSSNVNASNAVDAQAAYESQMQLWGAVLGHANLIHHAAGWLEGGLTASFEKMIIDAEMLQMMAALLEPLEVTEETLALDAIRELGPGGHVFGAAHAPTRDETASCAPPVSDRRDFETWEAAGARTATMRANGIWKRRLADYRPPPLDAAIDEALRDYMARRRPELEKAAAAA